MVAPYLLNTDFNEALPSGLTTWQAGSGRIDQSDGVLTLHTELNATPAYADAQIMNYLGLRRADYPCRPPLRMSVRAWASHSADQLRGTAGFGFWNQPFMPGQLGVRLPRALWFFFASPPSNMKLVREVPGSGWKAATLDATRLPFLLLAPFTPIGFLIMRIPMLYQRLWGIAQRAIGAWETPVLADLREPHTYRIDWRQNSAAFYVDDQLILKTSSAPRGALGFIAWLDNQYAIVTPQGKLGGGLIVSPEGSSQSQWLKMDRLSITPLDPAS